MERLKTRDLAGHLGASQDLVVGSPFDVRCLAQEAPSSADTDTLGASTTSSRSSITDSTSPRPSSLAGGSRKSSCASLANAAPLWPAESTSQRGSVDAATPRSPYPAARESLGKLSGSEVAAAWCAAATRAGAQRGLPPHEATTLWALTQRAVLWFSPHDLLDLLASWLALLEACPRHFSLQAESVDLLVDFAFPAASEPRTVCTHPRHISRLSLDFLIACPDPAPCCFSLSLQLSA
jgi:hypothetical protein